MAKFILGTKQNMTRYFDGKGRAFSATLVSAGPVVVTQVKKEKSDGYNALQVGYIGRKDRLTNKTDFRYLREFKIPDPKDSKKGDEFDVSIFSAGEAVKVSGLSKGKGFQGVVKRHGFHGGPRSHGQKHSEREPGSIGTAGVQRVLKGKKMAGRMGGQRITVKNLTILDIDKENNQLLIKGAVPGRRGTLLEIYGS